jgi:hypothetical protein
MNDRMVRKNIYMPALLWKQSERLAKFISLEEDSDISTSEVIRRALIEFIVKYDKYRRKKGK